MIFSPFFFPVLHLEVFYIALCLKLRNYLFAFLGFFVQTKLKRCLADDFVPRISVNALKNRIDLKDAPFFQGGPIKGIGAGHERQSEFLFAGREFFFGLLAKHC